MKLIAFVCVLGFVRSEFTQFTWKSCTTDMQNRALRVNSASVSPMPVLTPGDMHITFDADVLQNISLAILDFNLTRHTQFGPVHVPCIGTLGSCKLDGCSIVDDLQHGSRDAQRDLGRQIKAMFESVNVFTHCPIQVQKVNVVDYTFHIPELSSAVNFIADGDYTVVVKVVDPLTQQELGCFEFNATLKRKQQQHHGLLFGRKRRSKYFKTTE